MNIKKGDILTIRPEWQDPGDKGMKFLALEDEDGGRLPITPLGTGLMFPGNSVVMATMVKPTGICISVSGKIVSKKKG